MINPSLLHKFIVSNSIAIVNIQALFIFIVTLLLAEATRVQKHEPLKRLYVYFFLISTGAPG